MSDHLHDRSEHLSDEDLILFHYGEAPDAEAIAARLAASPEARQRYDELRRLLAAADEWTPPALEASFESDVWRRLQPRLAATPSRRAATLLDAAHRFGSRTRRWLPAAAAAVLLLGVGYLAGRFAPAPPPQPQTLSAEARQRILVETLAGHLERSQRLFTELVNQEIEGTELPDSQQAARELVAANRLYRAAAESGGREGVAALLDEMEPVLLELAHLPAEPQAEDLENLRQRVEAHGLLFKTRVASELLTRSLAAPPTTSPQRSTV